MSVYFCEECQQLVDDVEYEAGYFASVGDLIKNDWEANPNGEVYQDRLIAAGRSDLHGWSRDILYPQIETIYNDIASKYGWGEVPPIEFDKREEDLF